MACFNGRIPIEIMDKIVDLLDGRSLFKFEQTSKPNQVHVMEAFERKKHLDIDADTEEIANNVLLRCGPHLRTINYNDSYHPDYHGYDAYFDKLAKLGYDASSFEFLPMNIHINVPIAHRLNTNLHMQLKKSFSKCPLIK